VGTAGADTDGSGSDMKRDVKKRSNDGIQINKGLGILWRRGLFKHGEIVKRFLPAFSAHFH
jgi:hypothetical protein